MKTYFRKPNNPLPLKVYSVYALLIIPVTLILLINRLMSPLAPSITFIELEQLA